MSKLENEKNTPLYKQVEEYILNEIKSGNYKSGETIPPERYLCDELEVSRYTIRNAIQELVQKGYLYRVQGNGTFVLDNKENLFTEGQNIGVILTDCKKEMQSKILNGIEKKLNESSHTMRFMNSNNDYRKEAENIYRMKKEGVKGLIIMPAEDQKDSNAISDLKKEGFPFVLVDRRLQDCETNCVMSDNIEGAFSAVEHLIQLGHNKIAFLKNNYEQTSSIIDRITGYKKAIEEYSINEELIFSYDSNSDRESKNNKIFKMIKENSVTAILSMNDYVALDILKMCRKKDINIPDDLSIVGFDNLDLLKHLEVSMTTVAQHPFEIGKLAAEMLIEKISREKETKFITQNFYPTDLIIRNSTSSLK